jgi:hypothetical protein
MDGSLLINSINFYYSSVFSFERSIPQIQRANSGEPFAISAKIIREMLAAIGKNQLRRTTFLAKY